MGSATREALVSSRQALAALGDAVDLATAEDLFAASQTLGGSAQLRAAIADPSADEAGKKALVKGVFAGKISPAALSVLTSVASQRWSSQNDLLAALEELGIRALASSAPAGTAIDSELFAFGGTVSSDPELELALRSRLAKPAAKAALVEKLLSSKVSAQTLAIVRQLVLQPRGRSMRVGVREAAETVANEAGFGIATVTSAAPLEPAQLTALTQRLAAQYGKELRINQIIDPSILGGLRVQVGAEVIDDSIAARINALRLQLAG